MAGTIFQENEEDEFSTLDNAFKKCEEQNALGTIIRVLDYCVACIHCYSSWYLVDSHARSSSGMPDENGTAVVLHFHSASELVHQIRIFVQTATASRDLDITDLTFEALVVNTRRELARREVGRKHSDVAILPPTKLFSKVYVHGTIEIYNNSIGRLEKGKEMDDNLVDFFFLHTINTVLKKDQQESIYIFNSCFYSKIMAQFNPHATRNWTKNVDLFTKNVIVVPVCTNSHWLLVLIKVGIPKMSVMLLDSNTPEPGKAKLSPYHSIERKIKRYLEDEWLAKKPTNARKIRLEFQVTCPAVPQQPNPYDCGVYTMKSFEQFIKSYPIKSWDNWRPEYDQDDVSLLRREIQVLLQQLAFSNGSS